MSCDPYRYRHRPKINERSKVLTFHAAMNPRLLRLLPRPSPGASAALTPYYRTELARLYATQSTTGHGPRTTRKKNITVLSDDGQLQWGELTGREKFSRATQQSFNFMIVIAGVVLTVCFPCGPWSPWRMG